MTCHFKQVMEDGRQTYGELPYSATLSGFKRTCSVLDLRPVGWIIMSLSAFFFFLIQPVLLMCKHLEEKRDFTYCPDEQRAQGRPTKRTSESCRTRILYTAWMDSFDKIETINLWSPTFDTVIHWNTHTSSITHTFRITYSPVIMKIKICN